MCQRWSTPKVKAMGAGCEAVSGLGLVYVSATVFRSQIWRDSQMSHLPPHSQPKRFVLPVLCASSSISRVHSHSVQR